MLFEKVGSFNVDWSENKMEKNTFNVSYICHEMKSFCRHKRAG